MRGPGTPIRDISCCCHPLTSVPYLRPEPHRFRANVQIAELIDVFAGMHQMQLQIVFDALDVDRSAPVASPPPPPRYKPTRDRIGEEGRAGRAYGTAHGWFGDADESLRRCRSGALDRPEVQRLVAQVLGEDVPTELIEAVFSDMDADGDGHVAFIEFVAFFGVAAIGVYSLHPPLRPPCTPCCIEFCTASFVRARL